MLDQKLLAVVKEDLQKGMSEKQIKSFLMIDGWTEKDIEEALLAVSGTSQPSNQDGAPPETIPASTVISKKINKKIIWLIVSLILILLFFISGAFAYFYYFKSPERVIRKMMLKTAEIESLEYSGEISGEYMEVGFLADDITGLNSEYQPQVGKTRKFIFNFAGNSDTRSIENQKSSFSFNIKTDAISGQEDFFALEIRAIGKIVYLKLNEMPAALGSLDFNFLKNQWVKIDTESLQKQINSSGTESQNEEPIPSQDLSPEQSKKIKDIISRAKIVKKIERLPSERFEGVDTYHYKIFFDDEGIKKFIIDVVQVAKNQPMSQEEVDEFRSSFSASESLPDCEIWIGKKDSMPYKIYMDIQNINKNPSLERMNLTLYLKNFNKPVQIDAPGESKSLDDIIEEFSSKYVTPDFNDPNFDAKKDSDSDGLPDYAEGIYGTDPAKDDSDGDGYNDFEEIRNGYSPSGPGKLENEDSWYLF